MVAIGVGSGVMERLRGGGVDRLEEELVLDRGSVSEYGLLGGYHYLAGRPATAMQVWVLRRVCATVVGRFLGRRGERELVGMLVESVPRLNCRARDWAIGGGMGDGMGGRYSRLPVGQRGVTLFEEVRCISRVVVHPQWRGLGLAVRLVKHSLEHAQTRFVEAIAAMGKVHPFFEKAGMLAYELPCGEADARLRAALGRVGVGEYELVDVGRARGVIEGLGEAERYWVRCELRRWYRGVMRVCSCGGGGGGRLGDLEVQLLAARDRLGFEPVYYLKDCGG